MAVEAGAIKIAVDLAASEFKSALAGLGKAAVAGAAAAGAAVVALSGAVLSAYADYEQLVGGVDTLFRDSSDKIKEYADNAYKTAGLSANEYMRTVTGFSASLLQSLGGDTEAAASYADMAITDMADNANKMGSSMEDIQNAYQGFAKQNYTMLDNLKLGYGGTKEEMQRLLADAEKLSGIKYDLSSYADVVSAIHVVQTEMGITGTTALEAEKTISGSVSALAGAFQNLLVGFGDANADIGALCENMVESLKNVITNVTPIIQNIISALPQVAAALLDSFVGMTPSLLATISELFELMLTSIMESLPKLIPAGANMAMTIIRAVIDNLPAVASAALSLIQALAQGLIDNLPELIPAAASALLAIVSTIADGNSAMIDTAIALILALAEGILNALPIIIEAAPKLIETLVNNLTENLPKILSMGVKLLGALVTGIINSLPTLVQSVPKIIAVILKGLADGVKGIIDAGANLVKGVWSGISGSLTWIKNKIKGWVGNVTSFIKRLFGINSPSTVMRDLIGKNLVRGIGVGVDAEMPALERGFKRDLDNLSGYAAKLDLGIGKRTASLKHSVKLSAGSAELVANNTIVLSVDGAVLANAVNTYNRKLKLMYGGTT